jgi:hypothetical protein
MSAYFAPELWPFVFATVLMVVVFVLEGRALLVGHSASHWLDSSMSHVDHAEGFANSVLGWLHVGKIPVLASLVVFLTSFAVVGFAVQFAAGSIIGRFLPAVIAGLIAFFAALPVVRVVAGWLAAVLPKDETRAVSDASLVGRVATIGTGTAALGRPAQARLNDEHGTTHYVMVEPEEPAERFEQGASVLLVRRLSGRRFQAIRNPKPGLL